MKIIYIYLSKILYIYIKYIIYILILQKKVLKIIKTLDCHNIPNMLIIPLFICPFQNSLIPKYGTSLRISILAAVRRQT